MRSANGCRVVGQPQRQAAPVFRWESSLRSAGLLAVMLSLPLLVGCAHAAGASFEDFDRRAKAGDRLNVVFFGASLTWGANATDPNLTSYRAQVARRLEEAYPKAHLRFWDAAIGGTGSQLAVFRLDRDVLRHQPDLVFLDFSANDDVYSDSPEPLAAYESLVRRIITEAHAPVVQVVFPFGWNVKQADFDKMKRRAAHIEIARAYNTAVGDAIALAAERVRVGKATIDQLWPVDWVHPCDAGYELFADAAWAALQEGIQRKTACIAPQKMLHAETYLKHSRVRLTAVAPLPQGWRVGKPNFVSAYYDMLMSRWLDDQVIASNRRDIASVNGQKQSAPQEAARLKVRFNGSMVMLFGEGTPKSGKYRVYLDGKLVERKSDDGQQILTEFDAAGLARPSNGNTHHVQVLAQGLSTDQDHTLEIEPVFAADQEQELRFESLCVAGGNAIAWRMDR